MDRLQSMRAFVRVVEQGGFARAARALNISDTVVTRLVADLENHLGTRLLNRTTRKLSLTETGQAYLERVRQILQDIEDADAIAGAMSRKPAGTLRIYSSMAFGRYQLSTLLPQFAAAHPEIVLDVTYSDRAVDLVGEGFDAGILIGDLQQFDATMIARQLGRAKTLLVASAGYIKKHGEPLQPADLASHQCLNYPFEQVRHHWSLRNEHGAIDVPVVSRVIANSGDLLRDCALADMGIFILPSFAAKDDLSCERLVRILPAYHLDTLPIALVYPSRRLLSSKVRVFVDFMMAQFPDPEADNWLS
ncbi:LysR family transcriptional regulator [Janthinobacterium sp. 17J80-10]|uniref:LysR family transcriptional regulator n=1 Tax=Janthinobacterium sp. 17J80-10 TaxID=2497863 RepID=UPI001005A6D9|nr:LysR family transcriptional regulator [Janthinobacterium sp. 17J80-10]QAU33408.1 LysR family transcriptional regulator [Janthinobacterium sp. 17J80-10]